MSEINIDTKAILNELGIEYLDKGKELQTVCIFNSHQKDKNLKNGRLYFNVETGQYYCQKCDEYGNLVTLAKFLGNKEVENKLKNLPEPKKNFDFDLSTTILKFHNNLSQEHRKWLNDRGISDEIINEARIGYSEHLNKRPGITIPILDKHSKPVLIKIRHNQSTSDEKFTRWPAGQPSVMYWTDKVKDQKELLIVEGEFDLLALVSTKQLPKELAVVSGIVGAGGFDIEILKSQFEKIYICQDNDEAGKKGVNEIIKKLDNYGYSGEVCVITLPEIENGKDITDYLKANYQVIDLFSKYSKQIVLPGMSEEKISKLFFDKKTYQRGIAKLAEYLIKVFSVKTVGWEKRRDIYIYQDGYYKLGFAILDNEIKRILGESYKNNVLSEVIAHIQSQTLTDMKDFDQVDINKLNLDNGVYDIKTKQLEPHSPKYLFLFKLPVKYDPSATCPEFMQALNNALNTQEEIDVIQEWYGYTLYRKSYLKKALILVGKGDGGKTLLIDVNVALVGKDNKSGISLQELASQRFAKAELQGKHLNYVDDLKSDDIKSGGPIKELTGGITSIMAERKHGIHFNFEPFAKQMFAANKVPDVKDQTDAAYFGRWIIIVLDKFRNMLDSGKAIKDPKLTKRIIDNEMSGVLNFALAGLDRLLKNNRFSFSLDENQIKELMLKNGLSLARFVYEKLEEGDYEDFITKEELYKIYRDFCRSVDESVMSLNTFAKKIINYADYLLYDRKYVSIPNEEKMQQKWGWRHIKIKQYTQEEIINEAEKIFGGKE